MWQSSEKKNIVVEFLLWHYFFALKEIFLRWRDFLLFNFHYFSIAFLLKTLFSPWKRYSASFGRGFRIGRILESFAFNIFSRTLGAVLRTILIFVGTVCQLILIIIGASVVILWIALPFITVLGIYFSLSWLIYG